MEKRYFTAIYCPPNPPRGEYPNRITERSFRLLKEAGIDHVFGYYEDRAGNAYLEKALDCSAAAGILFYPRMEVFDRFTGVDDALGGDIPYTRMTESEREKLTEDFIGALAPLAEHEAFGGIFFGDERGCDAFAGIGAAGKIFAREFPRKKFFYNHLNYFLDDGLFFHSAVPVAKEKQLSGDLAYCAENRFRRYDEFMKRYFAVADAEYLSTDLYPFALTWKTVPTSVHRGLYESCSLLAKYKAQRGVKCLVYVQVGNWDGNGRKVGRAEMALQMGIAAAYGFDGFVFFPGCFPNDWLGTAEICAKDGQTALLDVGGEPTAYYGYARELNAVFQSYAPFLAGKKHKGVQTAGVFCGGFSERDVEDLPDSECIYRGGLPENEFAPCDGGLPEIDCSSQLFIGVFEDEGGKKTYLFVNNSIVAETSVCIRHLQRFTCVYGGKTEKGKLSFRINALPAGESFLIAEE